LGRTLNQNVLRYKGEPSDKQCHVFFFFFNSSLSSSSTTAAAAIAAAATTMLMQAYLGSASVRLHHTVAVRGRNETLRVRGFTVALLCLGCAFPVVPLISHSSTQ